MTMLSFSRLTKMAGELSNKITIRIAFLKKLEELRLLCLPLGDYAITGSGPLAIHGLGNRTILSLILFQKEALSFYQERVGDLVSSICKF